MAEITAKNNEKLFGHDEAERALLAEYTSGKLAHGWLFSGPKGIGKATLAYRFARMLLAGRDDMEMDGDDPIFRRTLAGSHTDFLVVEPQLDPKKDEIAREISVEQAREIAQFLSLTPGESKWRVVIVDSVDQLNNNGANAILKIFEEPPPQALLILISHNPGRLLPTIRSRCRSLKLQPLSARDFARTMLHIAPDLSDDILSGLKEISGGSPGVAQHLHEQGALSIYSQMLELAADPNSARLHMFADSVAGVKSPHSWPLFTRLMLALLQRITRTAAGLAVGEAVDGERMALEKLAAQHGPAVWAAKWQQCADQFSLAERVHLDYKQVIITFFHSMTDKDAFLAHAG
jgi:DNA polymerase-3 subunit delta'